MQAKIIVYVMFGSWLAYLLCFRVLDLGSAPPYVWLLMVATLTGIVSTGRFAFKGREESLSRNLLVAAVVLLLLMYGVQWADIVLGLGRAMPSDSTVQLFQFMFSTKARLVASLFQKRELIQAIQQAYWELMPLVQILLVYLWAIMRRSKAQSGIAA